MIPLDYGIMSEYAGLVLQSNDWIWLGQFASRRLDHDLVVTARLRAVAAQDTYDRVTVTICHRTGGHLQTEDFLFRDFNLD